MNQTVVALLAQPRGHPAVLHLRVELTSTADAVQRQGFGALRPAVVPEVMLHHGRIVPKEDRGIHLMVRRRVHRAGRPVGGQSCPALWVERGRYERVLAGPAYTGPANARISPRVYRNGFQSLWLVSVLSSH